MKASILLILLLIVSTSMIANYNVYLPDGRKIEVRFNNIAQLLDSLKITEVELYNHKLGGVYFKKLSNNPIFIIFYDKEYPSKIKEMIASYDYKKYLDSYSYYYDLNDMIKKGTLTKEYLYDVFEDPDSKGEDDEGLQYWIFKKFNVKITFKDDMPSLANVINYNAIQKNGLAISTFEVTGSDATIGFDIGVINFASRSIKYIFITVIVENPVKDKIATKIVKAIGPIKTGDPGSYEFEDIVYSKLAKYLYIENIKIQYMDSSIKLIPKSEIGNIRIKDWEKIGHTIID